MGALFMGNKPLVHVDHRRVPPALPEALLQGCFTPAQDVPVPGRRHARSSVGWVQGTLISS